jgi:hypothetical protein
MSYGRLGGPLANPVSFPHNLPAIIGGIHVGGSIQKIFVCLGCDGYRTRMFGAAEGKLRLYRRGAAGLPRRCVPSLRRRNPRCRSGYRLHGAEEIAALPWLRRLFPAWSSAKGYDQGREQQVPPDEEENKARRDLIYRQVLSSIRPRAKARGMFVVTWRTRFVREASGRRP